VDGAGLELSRPPTSRSLPVLSSPLADLQGCSGSAPICCSIRRSVSTVYGRNASSIQFARPRILHRSWSTSNECSLTCSIRSKDRSQLVDHAIHLFRGKGLRVTACARSIGVSERRLSQVFREEVGMTPKLWCRIKRFQAVTKSLYVGVDIPWADLALDCGYCNQSHFSHELRAFSGIDPTTYSAHTGRWQNHISVV